jgi:hypothetical protein
MPRRNRHLLSPRRKSGNTSDRLVFTREKSLDEALAELLAEGKIVATANENGEMLYKICPSGSEKEAEIHPA